MLIYKYLDTDSETFVLVNYLSRTFLPPASEGWGKVLFSVCLSVHISGGVPVSDPGRGLPVSGLRGHGPSSRSGGVQGPGPGGHPRSRSGGVPGPGLGGVPISGLGGGTWSQ